MQAIEFETHVHDGVIELPLSYQHWQEGLAVKVIVLVAEHDTLPSKSIQRHAGTITLTQDPLAFQAVLRDEWQ
ncbi:hypothetical protein CKO09_01700 [Chromatium weissei]|nr:hypothetical protein [Chromatium weissei]